MKKILLITVGSIAIAGAIALYTYNSISNESVAIEETTSENDGGKIIETKETDVIPIEEEFPMDISEYQVQAAIHAMSHQKVKADEKWSELQLTQERVERLLAILEKNKYKYNGSYTLYKHILTRWAEGDFSLAVDDHNVIWEIQGGGIGEAERLLTPEEEQAFIEKHFKVAE